MASLSRNLTYHNSLGEELKMATKTVFCEECGERYVLKPVAKNKYLIEFRCRICQEMIKISRSEEYATPHVAQEINEGGKK